MPVSGKSAVVCTILWIFYFECCFMLNLDSKGVCSVKISTPRTRTKYYTTYSNKWCGKKKCVVKKAKKETYSVTTEQTVCCNGYQYNSDTDVCIPQCSTGCQGGFCIEPEVCQCTPPAHLENNICKSPTCECINGDCEDNSCKCSDNYFKLNSTYCVPKCSEDQSLDGNLNCVPKCKVGFEFNDDKVCVPKCDEGYYIDVEGNCVQNCKEGFILDSNSNCVHNCPEGFEQDDDNNCVPKCVNCTNGNCTQPNVCTCEDGFYVGEHGNCLRNCDVLCINGSCTISEDGIPKCLCQEGYNLSNEGVCEPKCECENGLCNKSGHCQCNPGFQQENQICRPICNKTCVNSTCTNPDECTCFSGYEKDVENYEVCRPICRGEDCKDNSCSKPKYIIPIICHDCRGSVRDEAARIYYLGDCLLGPDSSNYNCYKS